MPRLSKYVGDLRSLARVHTFAAIKTLAAIMHNPKSADATRVTAADILLSRGWGKPNQDLTVGGDAEIRIIVEYRDPTLPLESRPVVTIQQC